MAPVSSNDIPDLHVSSLELDARSTTLDEVISRSMPASLFKRDDTLLSASPTELYHSLTVRNTVPTKSPDHSGGINPHDINMKGLQALFAIIGASFAVAIVWFFFWAKNGGFHWRKGDWEDYKSTVLRRKGPNGTTLSGATESTVLGGGSVVGEGYSDGNGSTIEGTFTDTMTDLGSDAPIIREKRVKKETAKERKIREAKEAQFEGGHDADVLAYIREKPARVGGINKDSEALHYGTDYTDTEGSAIYNVRPTRQHTPRGPPSAHSSRQPSPEKRQSRRDFSYSNDDAFSSAGSSHPDFAAPPVHYPEVPPPAPPHRPGRYHSPSKQFNQPHPHLDPRRSGQYARSNVSDNYRESSVVSDVQSQNTMSYHHPLPGLNTNQSPVRGYRRDRRDSLDD